MSYEVAAEAYDQLMGRWSYPLARQLADVADVRAGLTALDVGCGPGALTAELAARLGPGAVTAIDPSATFVAAARERNPGVDVRQASAEALPFPDATFDVALAQLVVHLMADPRAGLAEMVRVTRPGGIVAACAWDPEGGHGPLGPFWQVARELDPALRDEARAEGARAGNLAELLTAAGLRDVTRTSLSVSRDYPGFEAWWEPFTLRVGPAGAFVARLGPEREAELRERCRSRVPAGSFTFVARALAARGVVP